MTKQELKDLIAAKIAGQGNQVDSSGSLPTILNEMMELGGGGGASAYVIDLAKIFDEEQEYLNSMYDDLMALPITTPLLGVMDEGMSLPVALAKSDNTCIIFFTDDSLSLNNISLIKDSENQDVMLEFDVAITLNSFTVKSASAESEKAVMGMSLEGDIMDVNSDVYKLKKTDSGFEDFEYDEENDQYISSSEEIANLLKYQCGTIGRLTSRQGSDNNYTDNILRLSQHSYTHLQGSVEYEYILAGDMPIPLTMYITITEIWDSAESKYVYTTTLKTAALS